ncbi:MAG: hypothetical protein ACRDQW_10700 [Haloechinothrix sp.]
MQEEHKVAAGPDRSDTPVYVPMVLVDAGDVVELTNGTTSNDTADRKAYYW